uniref:Uncharacterized protein n=1 Tax=Cucumis melo TaxID=3656 RepID=A0A9I9ELX0_CUCME
MPTNTTLNKLISQDAFYILTSIFNLINFIPHICDMLHIHVRVARLPSQYAYHFGNKTEWGARNIITQDGIHSFPPLGEKSSALSLYWRIYTVNEY